MERLLPSPNLSPADALTTSLQKLNIATGTASSTSSTSNAQPVLIRKNSANLGGSLPNSPLRRKSSSPALPGSPSTRSISRSPSMASLSKLELPAPPLPPLTHPDAGTIVILNDSSYLHKYSRDISEKDLSLIVERPERLRAATFGVSVALCKLEAKNLSVIKTDRKGSLDDPSVTRVHNPKYPAILLQACDESENKIAARQNELPSGWHTGDLFLCGGSREDLEGCVGALWEGVDKVFGNGNHGDPKITTNFNKISRAFVCIRPPGHHCADDEPSGFCYLNNVHIAIARAAQQYDLTHAVILDFDLHHGDGSQSIAWTVNDRHNQARKPKNTPHIAYYSLHDINSYPCENGDFEKVRDASTCIDDAHHQNIWNVHLETYEDAKDFWRLYRDKYSIILQKAESFLAKAKATYKPSAKQPGFKAGIFISAGFDASEHEEKEMQRHTVHVLTEFYAKFTSDAVKLADKYAEGRVLSVLEGGYSDKAIWTGVFSHLCGLALPETADVNIKEEPVEYIPDTPVEKVITRRSSLAQDITGKSFRSFASESGKSARRQPELHEYDSAWFSRPKLEEIDKAMCVVPSVRATSKPRDVSRGDFSSPTASSAAKIAPKLHRKSSTNLADSASSNRTPSPPPVPPPLEWPAASAAVWKSLLPEKQLARLQGRGSPPPKHPAAELTVEKGRRQVKRHSAVGIPAVDNPAGATSAGAGRHLRSSKKPIPDIPERSGSALSSVAESQVSRRTSMVSIKSADTADTAITGVSQTSGRRRTSPPQKTVATSAAGTSKPVTAAKQPAPVKKATTAASTSTAQSARAPARSSSLRQSTGPKTASPPSRTHGETAIRAQPEDKSVSPVERANVPAIRTTTEPEQGSLETITSGLQSIKLTYKNRDRDQAVELDARRRAEEKTLKRDLTGVQGQKNKPGTANANAAGSSEPKSALQNGAPSQFPNMDGGSSDCDQAPLEAPAGETLTEGNGFGKRNTVNNLPVFTATSVIPFAGGSKEALAGMSKVNRPNGTSFKDRVAAFSPFQPKSNAWAPVVHEMAAARAYKPAGTRTLPPHSPEQVSREPSPRRADEDVKEVKTP